MRHLSKSFLCVSLVVLCLSSAASAYSGGDGNAATPYQIADVNDWQQLMETSTHWSKSFVLIADVNLAGVTLTPVGNAATNFTGTLDGKRYTISNAAISAPNTDYLGLFGYVGYGGHISNLSLTSVNMTGRDNVGGIVAYLYFATITNCRAEGSVTGHYAVGVLAGGGYCSAVTDCSAAGTSKGTGYPYYTAGLMGRMSGGTLSRSSADCAVYGGYYGREAGGLIARVFSATVSDCYATGSVSSDMRFDMLGGCVGHNYGSQVIRCYSTGSVVPGSSSTNIGGLIGLATSGATTVSSFWDTDTSLQAISYGGIGKTTTEMKDPNTFLSAGWDFLGEAANGTADTWRMCADGVDYPRLTWEYVQNGDFACPDGVAMDDLARFADDWLLTYSTPLYGADADGDSSVTFLDFAVLAANWLD